MSEREEFFEAIRTGSEQRARPETNADQSEAAVQIENSTDVKKRDIWQFSVLATLLRIKRSGIDGSIGNAAYDSLKRMNETVQKNLTDLSIRPEFIKLASQNSHKENLKDIIEGNIPGALTPLEASCIRSFRALNEGNVIHPDDYVTLNSSVPNYKSGDGAAFTRTLLSSHLVRIGATREASRLIGSIDERGLSSDFQVRLIQEKLSSNYVSIPSRDALETRVWNFGPALQTFAPRSEEFGFRIESNNHLQPEVIFPERIDKNCISAAARHSVRGFYIIFFPMLYSAANTANADLSRMGDLFYFTLKEFSPYFPRQVWNAAYISALQFHRQGEFSQRDRLLRICLRDSDFWGSLEPEDRLGDKLKGSEIIPMMAAHFMRSTPSVIENLSKIGADKIIPQTNHILNMGADMLPSSPLQSIDMIRKVAQQNLSPALMVLRHGIHLEGNNIYHEPAHIVRAGLEGRRGASEAS